MIEETLFQHHFPRGEYQDILLEPDGDVIWQTPWQSNLLVIGMSRALAALMKGKGNPLTFWAVGTGSEAWDNLPPNLPSDEERSQLTQLYKETKRKEIKSEQIALIGGLTQTNQLQIRMDFTADDIPDLGDLGNRQLREFGLFAGGTDSPNTGILINHRIHPRIDLQEGFTLQRTLRLTF